MVSSPSLAVIKPLHSYTGSDLPIGSRSTLSSQLKWSCDDLEVLLLSHEISGLVSTGKSRFGPPPASAEAQNQKGPHPRGFVSIYMSLKGPSPREVPWCSCCPCLPYHTQAMPGIPTAAGTRVQSRQVT